mmetsp:Transcript_13332/g.16062  ORF Transcript_13332/g.16062 Transcript_13332/m.16062 type:complete len:278 (+) Transcript_13332:648-1481(+)
MDKMTIPNNNDTNLRALGFCGADDSVHPHMLGIIAHAYPFVEFGVLFRPDKEGEPRYASKEWVDKLSSVVASSGGTMKLAAHLCGSRVNEVLKGDDTFLSTLPKLGFQRVQINATAVNGVDVSNLAGQVSTVADLMTCHPELEFILQKNDETKPLWQGLLKLDTFGGGGGLLPPHVSMLVDESKGTGVLASSWPKAPEEYPIGYAGGIGPANIVSVLEGVLQASQGKDIWIDMESSLRSTKNGQDVFDLDKCYSVIHATCSVLKLYDHPEFLTTSSS